MKKGKIHFMGYEVAVNKAWDELAGLVTEKTVSARFLADEYTVNLLARTVISSSCNVPAKDFVTVIILHYLIRKVSGLPDLTGEWMPFRELAGIEGYYDAFRKRAIDPVIRKYGKNPDNIFSVLERFPSRKGDLADASVVIDALPGVPVMVELWRSDEDFGPDANIMFDKSVSGIFCTEDIIVLAGLVAASL